MLREGRLSLSSRMLFLLRNDSDHLPPVAELFGFLKDVVQDFLNTILKNFEFELGQATTYVLDRKTTTKNSPKKIFTKLAMFCHIKVFDVQ